MRPFAGRLGVDDSAPAATRSTTCRRRYAFGAQRRVSGTVSRAGRAVLRRHDHGVARRSAPARVSILQAVLARADALDQPRRAAERRRSPRRCARTRVDYGFSPLMFASALLQYSSADRAFSSNLRFRWEYRPGSELFVVYTDERDTTDDAIATPTHRARPEEPRVRRQDQPAAAILTVTRVLHSKVKATRVSMAACRADRRTLRRLVATAAARIVGWSLEVATCQMPAHTARRR